MAFSVAANPQEPLAVSAVVAALKALVEPTFRRVWVQGELSGVKHHPSGHWYFALKDDQAQLRGVMFRRDAERLAFPLKDGSHVAIRGRLGVFERDGQTQIYAQTIEPVGVGAQRLAFEALYRQLKAEGIFDRPKRQWPRIPRRVAVITAESGAARRDIEAVAARRFPGLPLDLIPASVQGARAVEELLAAIRRVDPARHDVVIIGRGGGAAEDLQAFNAEAVVRAVAACPVPVISAVGHEIDSTLTDHAADRREPTPSAAAEQAIPDRAVLLQEVAQARARFHAAAVADGQRRADRLARIRQHPVWQDPARVMQGYQLALDRRMERWDRALERAFDQWTQRLALARARFAAVDPTAILSRGYAYVTDAATGQVVTAAAAADRIRVHWADGTVGYHKEG